MSHHDSSITAFGRLFYGPDMPQDDISALNAKVDLLIDAQKQQSKQLAELKTQFDESKGALSLVKWAAHISIGLGTIAVAIWATLHGK